MLWLLWRQITAQSYFSWVQLTTWVVASAAGQESRRDAHTPIPEAVSHIPKTPQPSKSFLCLPPSFVTLASTFAEQR